MMGRLTQDQGQLFYSFCLDEVVPCDHRVREIAGILDLSWVHAELAPHYSAIGRPSIDPVLMVPMLLGYVFAIRSERAICRKVQVNLAYRWFCGLSIEDKIPDHSAFTRAGNERFPAAPGNGRVYRIPRDKVEAWAKRESTISLKKAGKLLGLWRAATFAIFDRGYCDVSAVVTSAVAPVTTIWCEKPTCRNFSM